MICKCLLFSSSFFFGRRLAQGAGKGVCLLWLWNEPPYVKASAVVLASVLFTVTLSHLIRSDANCKQMVLLWCTVFSPPSSSAAFMPERKFGYPSSKWSFLANLTANYLADTYCICDNISSYICLIHHKLFPSKQLLMSLMAAIFRSKRVSLPIIWRRPSSCFSTPATRALICSRCSSLMSR